MNIQMVAGNLAKPAFIKNNGDRDMMALTVACNEGKDKEGNQRKAEFVDLIVWGKKDAFVNYAPYLVTGQSIAAEGKLVYGDSTEKDGVVYQTAFVEIDSIRDIELTGKKGGQSVTDADPLPQQDKAAADASQQAAGNLPTPEVDAFDDDIPFAR